MWLLRKRPNQLTEEELVIVKRLFTYSPLLGSAYVFCSTLTGIFDAPLTKGEARQRLRAWQQWVRDSGLTCFDRFLSTLDEWMDEITNYFVERHSSGFVEGLNNKIKVIKRRCYGIFKIGHLFQRLWLDLVGYEVFA